MSDIEKIKKKRAVSRTATTKLINTCEQYLAESVQEVPVLTEHIDQLNSKYNNLTTLDEQIQNLMDDYGELEAEFETAEGYSEK